MIRLGVIGHGLRISGLIKDCWREVEPDLRVVGIVDPDEAGARSRLDECDRQTIVFYKDLKSMVGKAKLDALAIGTRCNLHAPYAAAAAQYGLPLYLEKPVAVSMEQAVTVEKAFNKSKSEVVVSFPLRVSPLCSLARGHIAGGAVGTPEHILAVNYVPYGSVYFNSAYRDFRVTQGLFLQKATHDLDYMSYLVGSPIVRVAAMATRGRVFGGKRPADLVCSACDEAGRCFESPESYNRTNSGETLGDGDKCAFGEDIGSPETGMNEDSSSALVEFASGMHGVYTQVFYSRGAAAARGATISGYHGTVSFDWYTGEIKRVRHHEPSTDPEQPGKDLSHFGGDGELAHDFIDLIRGKGRTRTTVWAGIQSIYACLAAKESSETGRFVDVKQVADTAHRALYAYEEEQAKGTL